MFFVTSRNLIWYFALTKKKTTMKKDQLLIILLLFVFVFPISGQQDREIKFANSSNNGNINMTESDSLGNIYIIGSFNETFAYQGTVISGPKGADSYNLFAMKVLPNGRPEFISPIYTLSSSGYLEFRSMTVNDKGEMVIAFTAYRVASVFINRREIPLTANANVEVVAKFSKTGFLNWVRVMSCKGGTEQIQVQDMTMDEIGNVYVTGYFNGDLGVFGTKTIDGYTNDPKMFLAKYTDSGTLDWVSSCNTVASPDTTGGITALTIELSGDNKVYVAGLLTGTRQFSFGSKVVSNIGTNNAYLACFHTTGDVYWARGFSGDGEISHGDINLDDENNVIFSCFYKSSSFQLDKLNLSNPNSHDLAIAKYRSNGDVVWENNLITNLGYVSNINNGDVHVFVGDSSDITILCNDNSAGVSNIRSVQYDSETGAVEWSKSTFTTTGVYPSNIVFDKKKNLYFLGTSYGLFLYDTFTVTDLNGYGVNYLCKIGDDGKTKFFAKFQNQISGSANFQSLGTDNYGNLMIIGSYYGDSASLGAFSLTDTSYSGLFFAKYAGLAKVSGQVFNFSGDPIPGGYIKLLGYAYYQRCFISDTVLIGDDGRYVFKDVPLGKYITHAFPGELNGVGHHPVFFPSSAHWEDALKINVNEPVEYSNMIIFAPDVVPLLGNSSISGKLTVVDSDDIFKSTQTQPRSNGRASLAKSKKKSDYDIIATTITDENGDFYFENIEQGEYFVLIEEPGLPNISVHEVSVAGSMYISNVNYLMTEETVEAVDEPTSEQSNLDKISMEQSFFVFPNPSQGYLNVTAFGKGQISSVKVTSVDGQEVQFLDHVNSPSVQFNLNPGIYLIHITGTNKQSVQKIIVR